ncbi:putative baseplate assembly protein, partial [Mycobacterium sp.]|uniref:putative baseplate assembly protein n=1 Tax=Mycobacterium sp. TaxID=1785 RepID=UPI002B81FD1A
HPQFLASMRARLASAEFPALAALSTRDPADFALALLDGWATIADVLTFYTERIANEGFLRTATEEFSVRRLAELVGYSPRPGLSATAYLAFTVTAGQTVPIPIGTKAQQLAPSGQLPATFETAEPLIAYGHLSTLAIRRSQPPLLTAHTLPDTTGLVFTGNLTDIRTGDRILLQLDKGNTWAIYEVTAVDVDAPANRTTATVAVRETNLPAQPTHAERITPAEIPDPQQARRLEPLVEALRKPASQPPGDQALLSRDLRDLLSPDKGGVTALLGNIVPEVAGVLDTALAHSSAANPHPPAVTRMRQSAMLFGATAPKFPTYIDGHVTGYVDPKVTSLKVDGPGENPTPENHPTIAPPNYKSSTTLDLDGVYPGIVADSELVLINQVINTSQPKKVDPVSFRTVKDVTTVTVSVLGLSTKVTRLTLDKPWPYEPTIVVGDPPPDANLHLHDVLDNTVVLAQPQNLSLAGESLDDVDIGCLPDDSSSKRSATLLPDAGASSATCGGTLELDGLYPELGPGRWLIVSGERTDAAIKAAQDPDATGSGPTGVHGAELVMVAAVEHRATQIPSSDGTATGTKKKTDDLPGDTVHTFVRLAAPLHFTYRRPSVVVYGNVARATHGETRREVLGSGDPSTPFARYPLKQPPLTYLPAPTAAGARATLDVFVDSVRWHQADSLLDIGPDDRCYVIDTDDDGNSAVVFGAARPPTGIENIQAQYRSGIGTSGNAAAASIITPLDQPLGVTAVTNPLPAAGGADRDRRDTVRRNAAVSVQALDRLVSVSDYADFATAFAGVGAASASELPDGRRVVVHVTIAGIDDAPIAATSDLTINLQAAMRDLGDPNQEVQVAVRTLKALVVSARVHIDPDRAWVDVAPTVRARLLTTFGPGHRDIGQGVAQSEVLAAIQSVPGVLYTDLTILDALGESELVAPDPTKNLGVRTVVPAALASFDPTATVGAAPIRPAELLILSPSAPDTLVLEAL